MSGKKSVKYLAPEIQEGPIPTGWNLETEVQKDGSKTSLYHCPDTGQHFYTYADLIRYVEYAKRKGLGIYSLCSKSVKKRETNVENNCTAATKARKTSAALSIRRRPSNSNSLNVDQSSDSKSSTSSESTDKEKDEDYVPEPNGDVSADLGVDHDRELNEMRRSKQPK